MAPQSQQISEATPTVRKGTETTPNMEKTSNVKAAQASAAAAEDENTEDGSVGAEEDDAARDSNLYIDG